ncbi:MAG: putative O-methyltransferase YrrM [Glaciecola sp.]
MKDKLNQIISYGKFRINSKTRHAVHSPFVFEMCQLVLRKDRKTNVFIPIEEARKFFRNDKEFLEIEDLGAGSKAGNSKKKKISTIAKYSLSSPRQCRTLYRLVNHYRPQIIVELGTSLGISTAYMAIANDQAMIYTIEGSEVIYNRAQSLFTDLNLDNIQAIHGDFHDRLPMLLTDFKAVDMAFIDGNHTYSNTIDYFEQIIQKSHNDTIIVVDDIYWSKEMKQAWLEIKNHERTKTTIDLYYFGIVLLREEMSKEHFLLRY